jgi:4-amino-4-deoxy-L-arabinose transferase-like glycosyltransferase
VQRGWLTARTGRGVPAIAAAVMVVLGVGLLNKPLPAFLALGLLAGARSRAHGACCATPTSGRAPAIALAPWSPWIVWQAAHSWPQSEARPCSSAARRAVRGRERGRRCGTWDDA